MIISDDDVAKLSEIIGRLNMLAIGNTIAEIRDVADNLRGIRDRLELEPELDDLDEALLIDLIPLDGGEPDEEHTKLMESFEIDDTSEETEDASLIELNALLAKCTRPARAEFVEDDGYEEDDELRDEQ
jgi:hypothetical protein